MQPNTDDNDKKVPRRPRRARRWLSLLCGLGLSLCSAPPARATITDLIQGLRSTSAPKEPRTLGEGQIRHVVLNGLPIKLIAETTLAPMPDVISYYRDHFQRIGPAQRPGEGSFAIQEIRKDAGFLIGLGNQPASAPDPEQKPGESLLSGKPLRLVYAQSSQGRTDYVVAWSEAPVPAAALSPDPDTDTPGSDIPSVPRPAGRRTLSFVEPGPGWSMAVYAVSLPPEQAFRSAVGQLHAAGFVEDPAFESSRSAASQEVKEERQAGHFHRAGRELLLSARPGNGKDARLTYVSRAP